MAKSGDTIENPVTGERLTFLETARDTDGQFLRFDFVVEPRGYVAFAHIHMKQSESFEVASGSLRYLIGKEERDIHAGEAVTVHPGTPHTWWNPSDVEELRATVEFRPALNTETFLENIWGLARDGKSDKKGVPSMLQFAVWFAGAYKGENYLASPPIPVQKALFALLAPIGRLRGYKDWYPEYTEPAYLPSPTTKG